MRFYKASLRTLIMLASTFSFLGGWALLAHSLKPASGSASAAALANVPAVSITPLPTLAPLDVTQSQPADGGLQNPFTIVAQPQAQAQSMPVFTTSGS